MSLTAVIITATVANESAAAFQFPKMEINFQLGVFASNQGGLNLLFSLPLAEIISNLKKSMNYPGISWMSLSRDI